MKNPILFKKFYFSKIFISLLSFALFIFSNILVAEVVKQEKDAKGITTLILEFIKSENRYILSTVDAKGLQQKTIWFNGIPEKMFVESVDFRYRTITEYSTAQKNVTPANQFTVHPMISSFSNKKELKTGEGIRVEILYQFDEQKKDFVLKKKTERKLSEEYSGK